MAAPNFFYTDVALNQKNFKNFPGSPGDGTLTTQIACSDIIILFVSSSFLSSDYCYETEMKQAMAQHASGRSVVVPVILRPCSWRSTPLGHLLALPTARMKGVPVRRLMLPRIPAPPEVMRGTQVEPAIHLAPALTNGHAVTSTPHIGEQRHDPAGAASTTRFG